MTNLLRQFLAVSLFLTVVSASIHLTYPKDITFTEVFKSSDQHGMPNYLKSVHLGSIAPGQTLSLVIDRASGTQFFWDNLVLTAPEEWQHTGAKHTNDFHADIALPQNAAPGTYVLSLYASGDMQVLTPAAINLSVDVRNDVYSFKADSSYPVYIDSLNAVPFTVKSDSLAQETVSLSLEGVPADWVEKKTMILAPTEERKTFFVVNPKTEGIYPVKLRVTSTLGGAGGSEDSEIIVYPASLLSKLKVLNEGFSIVTVILQPFYSLLSLIGSIF